MRPLLLTMTRSGGFRAEAGNAERHRVGGERARADEHGVAAGADFHEAALVALRGEIGRREIARADAAVGGDGEIRSDEWARQLRVRGSASCITEMGSRELRLRLGADGLPFARGSGGRRCKSIPPTSAPERDAEIAEHGDRRGDVFLEIRERREHFDRRSSRACRGRRA